MFRRYLLRAVMAAAIAAAIYLLYSTLKQYTFAEIATAMRAIPASHLAAGLGFAACSYFCLACSDWLAVRYAGRALAFPKTALASFTALSIGHNVGVAALSSGAVRYRFYSRWGLSAEDVAKIIVFCGVTVALGLSTLGSIGLYFRPDDAAKLTAMSSRTITLLAICCLLFPVVYLALAAFVRAPLRIWRWHFEMPRLHLAAAQMMIGTANFAFVAASLHQMLAALADANYLKVAAVSITANIAAIISHVPGGLGVLEATVTHILPGADTIAAVIAFRVVYYFIPLAIGLPILIVSELLLKRESAPVLEEKVC